MLHFTYAHRNRLAGDVVRSRRGISLGVVCSAVTSLFLGVSMDTRVVCLATSTWYSRRQHHWTSCLHSFHRFTSCSTIQLKYVFVCPIRFRLVFSMVWRVKICTIAFPAAGNFLLTYSDTLAVGCIVQPQTAAKNEPPKLLLSVEFGKESRKRK